MIHAFDRAVRIDNQLYPNPPLDAPIDELLRIAEPEPRGAAERQFVPALRRGCDVGRRPAQGSRPSEPLLDDAMAIAN